jgi:transposase
LREVPVKVTEEDFRFTDARFLPIVSAYAQRIGLVEEIDRLLDCDMEVSPGRVVLAMILDALSGRSPLFRLKEWLEEQDVELLEGEDIPVSKFSDYTLGRVLERVFEVGTNTILGAIAFRAVKSFHLETSPVRHDTTSQKVYGDYLLYEREDQDEPFEITYGFSKDHRPDLKQLIHSLLCVEDGIPVWAKVEDGNESDKTINKKLIPEMIKRMRMLGREDFIYVNDSALITKDNLDLLNAEDGGILFVSRLPMTYRECAVAISRAVEMNAWLGIGRISDQPETKNRKPASYRAHETRVTIYETEYRAVVVHSDAHDARRRKKVEKQIESDTLDLEKAIKELGKIEYACLPDAQAAVKRLPKGRYHSLKAVVQPKARFGRGRPRSDGKRKLRDMRYLLHVEIQPDTMAIDRAKEEAGCFVLITNTPGTGSGAVTAEQVLTIYKDQHTIERNFGFLKDPVFVNTLFLKSPRRIEALGLVLILALMIWRLMERTMRVNLKRSGTKITGWVNRQTSRPTSFMMTTKFSGVRVLTYPNGNRRLVRSLSQVQLDYLEILELSPDIFTRPPP